MSNKFNPLSDVVEYKGVQLVNAIQYGRCARCDQATAFFDRLTMQYLCSGQCVEQAYLELFERRYNQG